jgi:hypothetical protein
VACREIEENGRYTDEEEKDQCETSTTTSPAEARKVDPIPSIRPIRIRRVRQIPSPDRLSRRIMAVRAGTRDWTSAAVV